MAKSQQTFNKKEREKKRRKKRQEKLERRQQRKLEKEQAGKKTLEEQFSYVDADGNLTSTPPDPKKKKEVKAEDIVIGIPSQIDIPEEIERSGKVKFFNEEKGYGFIVDAKSQESIFVHINNTSEPITEGDKVTFEIEQGPKGLNAIKVELIQ